MTVEAPPESCAAHAGSLGQVAVQSADEAEAAIRVVFPGVLAVEDDAYQWRFAFGRLAAYRLQLGDEVAGRIATVHHGNPFSSYPVHYEGDPMRRHVSQVWQRTPDVYGLGFTVVMAALAPIVGQSTFLVRFSYQLIALGGVALTLWLAVASLVLSFIGILVGFSARNESAAIQSCLLIAIPMLFLGNIIFSPDLLPVYTQILQQLLPMAHVTNIFKIVLITNGNPTIDIWALMTYFIFLSGVAAFIIMSRRDITNYV